MFAEVLNSYNSCCRKYAAAYPDAVGAANLQQLTAVGGALNSLGSLCVAIRRNAQDRASVIEKVMSGRDCSLEELIEKIDVELGCDVSLGFSPSNSYLDRPAKRPENSPRRNRPSYPNAPPTHERPSGNRPSNPEEKCPEYRRKDGPLEERKKTPLNTPNMPPPQSLDADSIRLNQQYRHNFAIYQSAVIGAIKSCDNILHLQGEIIRDVQNAKVFAQGLDSLGRRPELSIDVVNKRIAQRAALVCRVKDARKKAESLSSRLAQRQALHFTDVDVSELENAFYRHQKIFEGKSWFAELQKKLGSYKLFLASPDARSVASRLQSLNSVLNRIAEDLNAVAKRVNSELDTEKERRAAVSAQRQKLDGALRTAQANYRRMVPNGALKFLSVSTASGTVVKPTLDEVRNAVSATLSPLWRQLSEACRQICNLQKDLGALSVSELNKTKAFPTYVIVGSLGVRLGASALSVPVLTTFPFARPRLFRNADDVAPFLLRLMYAVPVGCMRLCVIDHAAVGAHGRDFNQLLDATGEVVKIITTQDDIRGALQNILAYMGDLSKTKFTGVVTNWKEFNNKNPQAALPCTILVIYSFRGWEYREFELLEPILERGAQCGVFVVGVVDGINQLDERLRKNIKTERFAMMPPDLARSGLCFKNIGVSWQNINKVDPGRWGKIVSDYKESYEAKVSRTSHCFSDLYSDVPLWSCDSSVGIDAVIGWDASDAPLHLRLGFGKEGLHHALMGGRNGSGKSNLLHVIIRSLCYRYSPEELVLYLLDFKDGVEFFSYSIAEKSWLPHARTISVHNDPSYALAMFKSLAAEMEKRNETFKAAGVVGLEDYRAKTKRKMPRILVIVDEFTVMFSAEESKEQIGELISAILKRGRSTGIHLMLSTQTVASFGVHGAEEMFQQLAIRLALPADGSECILSGMDHSEVRSIRIPQCIYNNNAGAPGCNLIFVHPQFKIDDPSSADFRRRIESGVAKLGGQNRFPCRVFNGTVLPPMPSMDEIGKCLGGALSCKKHFDLVLGIHSDFDGAVCKVKFEDDAAEDHLLIAYEKDDRGAARGFRQSILRSLAALSEKKVLIYDPKRSGFGRLPLGFDVADADTERSELLEKMRMLRDSTSAHKVLIVENFESARYLHQKNSSPIGWDDEDAQKSESTDYIFKSAFEDADRIPFHVICFTHRARFSIEKLGGHIISKFSKKIAFCLNGEDMVELIPQARGVDIRNKILFVDESSPDGVVDILPYKSTLKV